MKKVCIVTGSRAEYGLLQPLIEAVSKDKELELQLIVTGMHLSPEFGCTYQQIEEDGYKIDEKIEILLSSDTTIGISKSMGLGIISFSEAYMRLKSDLAVVLGDRYEIFAAASAALIARIPIAHLHGGETTEGAIDEAIRHAITKMSQLHFTSHEAYRRRVIQLGEQPNRVYNVGALGVANIKKLKLLTKEELQKEINFTWTDKMAVITFHPVTLEVRSAGKQFENLLQAIDAISDLKVIFTKANSDTDGRIINEMIDTYVGRNRSKAIAFTSLGQKRYLSAVKYSDVVIGNSSSGIVEVPSFHIPTVNIGDRQKGRIASKSVINCEPDKQSIENTIKYALTKEFLRLIKEEKNPYEGEDTFGEILRHIKAYLNEENQSIKKRFYDIAIDEKV